LFLRIDAVLGIAGVAIGVALLMLRNIRPRVTFVATLIALALVAGAYMVGPLRAYAYLPIVFASNLKIWQYVLLVSAATAAVAALFVASRRPGVAAWLRVVTPVACLATVWLAAAYALLMRKPGGKLTDYDALALRMYAAFYVTFPALVAALIGYALAARRVFWKDPSFFVTTAIFSLFFFYKIRIVPEHFWAARRFLPVILPATLLLAAVTATAGLRQASPVRRRVSAAIGFAFLAIVAWHYARAAAPIVEHVEYRGMIPQLEQLAGRLTDADLLIVESRDAGSDAHVFGLPLAYVYARNVLVLAAARPDKSAFAAFVEWARTRYRHVYFLGGGGTDLLSRRWSASSVASQRFQVPEFESALNALPRGVRRKEFDFGLYELLPPQVHTGLWFDLDVGVRDDLHVVRFHAKEEVEGRTIRWTQRQSFVSISEMNGGNRELVLTMSNGGRPAAAASAEVSVYLDNRLLGTAQVGDGFRPYSFAIPPDLAMAAAGADSPAQLKIVTPAWNPNRVLGSPDDRDLGVMVDRVQVK
jgi:hypothetical protein